ncbi:MULTISPECIES: NAD-dependent epimerase/dehydratase family protein [Catenuloplanes]|uniref:dTDP-6-deoxy-L-talose 4-dehydrogenase [NAD(P)+] n=1 Tax=Catenuloplanes niger TaxID=587534 RepID=A0AAE3ZSS1_9ACTN|nr:NAD(P)-dependent oxidoreductase [Catenuloplanes niger]MDR7325207.1 dTDP-6-deoxy-L-talose 4-dehydrogenase [NAD(P)+] [Catenuloplanes niger]
MSDGRVVVVGGTGFLGRQVVKDLVAAGRDVLVLARRAPAATAGFRFRAVDVSGAGAAELAAVLATERPGTVVNATGGKWGLSGRGLQASCVGATEAILTALAATSLAPRFVHLGSVLEYGLVAPDTPGATQRSSRSVSEYDRFKLTATEAVLAAAAAGTVDAVVLRLANVTGPGVPPASLLGLVAGALVTAAERGGHATIELTALDSRRDYVDVRDVSEAIQAAIRVPGVTSPIPIGRGESVPVRTLVTTLIEISGVPATVCELPAPDPAGAAEDWTLADLRPARDQLGWAPRRTLPEALRALWHDALERDPGR